MTIWRILSLGMVVEVLWSNNNKTKSYNMYNVMRTLSPLFSDRDPFFRSMLSDTNARNSVPAVNIRETDQAFELQVELPGFTREQIQLKVEKDILTLSAEAKKESEETKGHWHRREFGYSSFRRSFQLPQTIIQEQIKAKHTDGVLYLTLPKKSVQQTENKTVIEIE